MKYEIYFINYSKGEEHLFSVLDFIYFGVIFYFGFRGHGLKSLG